MHERFAGAGGVLSAPWHARSASRAPALLGWTLEVCCAGKDGMSGAGAPGPLATAVCVPSPLLNLD